jgi:hypothetical protein
MKSARLKIFLILALVLIARCSSRSVPGNRVDDSGSEESDEAIDESDDKSEESDIGDDKSDDDITESDDDDDGGENEKSGDDDGN